MDTALPGLIIIMVLLLVVMILSQAFLSAIEVVIESWQAMQNRMEERVRTELSPIDAETSLGGSYVDVTLRNDGDTKLADFDLWDVIVEYSGGDSRSHVVWLPYDQLINGWEVAGIYLEAPGSPEVFDKNILNPGEEIVLRMWLSPTVTSPSTNAVTIATPNGITASTVFTH